MTRRPAFGISHSVEEILVAKTKTRPKPKTKTKEPTEVVVKYDLYDLPTAFHKAGLAGLVMLIESLKARREITTDEATYRLSATTAEITFTEAMVQTLMDDLYDARKVERAVKSKWSQAKVARPPTNAEKEAGTPFVYRLVEPTGQFLCDHYPDMPDDKSWQKLWRDMLWNIPRGRPTTREPYNQRTERQACKEGPNAWNELVKVQRARTCNSFHTAEISSSLLPARKPQMLKACRLRVGLNRTYCCNFGRWLCYCLCRIKSNRMGQRSCLHLHSRLQYPKYQNSTNSYVTTRVFLPACRITCVVTGQLRQ